MVADFCTLSRIGQEGREDALPGQVLRYSFIAAVTSPHHRSVVVNIKDGPRFPFQMTVSLFLAEWSAIYTYAAISKK